MYLRFKRIIIFCGSLLSVIQVAAQSPFSVNATLAVQPPYSTHISDYTSQPGKILSTLLNISPTGGSVQVYLLGSISSSGGISIVTDPAYKMPEPVTLVAGQPYLLSQSDLNHVFSSDHLIFNGITKQEVIYGNGLPEDEYQICIRAYDYNTGQPVSSEEPQGCATINITSVEPPIILTPLCGDSITSLQPQSIIMSWTMPPGTPMNTQYYLKIVEILPSDRDPNDAMNSAAHPAFFETTLSTTSFLYGPSEPALVEGKNYAFAVTAIDPTSKTSYRNGGLSEVCSFIYQSPKNPNNPNPPPNNNNPVPPPNNNNPAPPPVNNPNPISLMDAPQLNCSCSTTILDKIVNNSNAKFGSVVHVGAFEMTLANDVIEKNGVLTGTGTIPVPFLNSNLFKIRVEYSDLQVNASNHAIAGFVRAKRNGNAVGIMPAYDDPKAPAAFTRDDILKIGDYLSKTANNAIATVNNSINSVGWEMPFGIEQDISGEKIVIAITDIVFTPEQAGFNACLAFDVPEGGTDNKLALGAKNVCLKGNAGLCGQAVLFLVQDFKIDALNFTFIKATGNNNSQAGTYAIFDPNGFKQLHIKAEYDFSQDVIVRQSDKGIVKATFETDIKSWNNWYASVNIDPFFAAGYDDFGFSLKTPAFYDHSDSINAPDMPKGGIENKTNHLDKTWMGFFFSELDATLPAVIKRADNMPVSIAVKNFMIDNQGLTGDLDAQNVLAISDGDLNSWYYSLDYINVRFVNSSFIKGGLNGKLLLPVSGDPVKNPQDELDYKCTLSKPASADSSFNFQFVIQPKNNISAKLWEATLNLKNTSTIIVSNQKTKDNPKGDFRAAANLNGDITIEADLSPIPKIDIKAVEFQDFQLMTYSPYISGKLSFFGFASPPKSAGGFPVTISSINPVFKGATVGISFDLGVTLADIAALPNATTKLAILGDLTMSNGRPDWGNPRLEVDSIGVKGPLGPLDIEGYVKFFDNDVKYGNGLKGALQAKLSLGVNKVVINSHIMFGHTSFYYWYVDLSYLTSIGTPIVPPVSMFGLGGGAYYNMSKATDISPDALLKGTTNDLNRYTPTNNVFGLKASIVVGVGNGTPFHATGTLSMELTHDFGVLKVGLDVDAAMMAELTSDINSAPVNGHGLIAYDFPNKIFDAGVGLNVHYSGIKGNGWMAININGSNGEWYFKLGSPEQRININILDLATINAYLMMGSQVGGIPDPPAEILKDFPDYKSSRDKSIFSNINTPGFAFGAGLQYGPVDLTFLMFYMNLSAGMGFDVNLKQYSTGCDGGTDLPGINGWYANGQFYAWVKFAFGLDLDVWFYTGRIEVAKVEAAALFQAGLVNPSWFEGWLYGHFDVLNGLISGTMHFHASVGNKCVPAGNPLGSDLPIIAELKPGDKENDISIGRNPQVAFNYPVNYDFDVTNTNSSGNEVLKTIHINVTEFTVRRNSDNKVITDLSNNKNVSFTDEMKLGTLYTKEAFDPQTDYTLTVTVRALDAKTNQVLQFKGKDVVESQTITFTTGDCLHRLDENAQTMLGSYPFKNQRYLLQAEQPTGFIQLDKSYPCLLSDPDYTLLAQFVSYQSPSQTTIKEVSVGMSGDKLTFPIPALPNEQITQLRIIKRRSINSNMMIQKASLSYTSQNIYASGNSSNTSNIVNVKNNSISGSSESAAPKDLELYNYYFKTSKYNTLAEKLSASDHSANAIGDGVGELEGYSGDFNFDEGFDEFDINQTTFVAFGNEFVIYPLIHVSEQAPGNAWMQNYVKDYFYANWSKAYTMAGDYREGIEPSYIRKSATGLQCLTFDLSLNPVGFLPMSAEPPLSDQEIQSATSVPYKNVSQVLQKVSIHP
jgi:TANFOR domain-containing protein